MRELTNSLTRIVTVFALLCCGAAVNSAGAQERERHMISARAGGVNDVVGQVTWLRQGETGWQTLTTEHNLRSGDRVRTGIGSRVEILLNPGSYLRLGENSEVELSDAALDHLRLRLLAGSAIIEAANAPDDNEALLEIATPHTTVAILRNGLYRINVLPGANASEVLVHNGRALVGIGLPVRLDSSRRVVVSAGQTGELQVVRFNRDVRDTFDEWSRERGRTVLAANRSLSNLAARTALNTFNEFDAHYARAQGLWLYNPTVSCYAYVPWQRGWSPYGTYWNTLGFWGLSQNSVCRCDVRRIPTQSFQPTPIAGGGGVITTPTNPNPGAGTPPRRRPRSGDGNGNRPVDGHWRSRPRPADGERSERRERWQRPENSERGERRERGQRSENGERRERGERGERGNYNSRSGGGGGSSSQQSESASPRAESAPQRSEPPPSAPAYSPPAQSYSPPPEPPAARDVSPPVERSSPRVEGNATP